MSIPRRLGRMARGFVLGIQDDERFRESIRVGRERGETLKETFGDALGAAWRGAAEEWRTTEDEREEEEQQTSRGSSGEWRERATRATNFIPRKYPLEVLNAYSRLGLNPGVPTEEVHKKRRDLIKRVHPDRFSDPDKRARAERLSAEINAAHDTIVRQTRRG